MAQNADSVLVEVETRLNTASNRAAEAQFDQSMNRIGGSATKAERVVKSSMDRIEQSQGRVAQRSRLLGFQIADLGTQFASGTNMGVAFAQQMPQIANALDGTTGAVGRLAAFLSGPLGAAILAAGSVLFILATRHDQAAEKADKQTDSSKTLVDAIRDLDKATADAIRTTEQSNRQKEVSAKKNLDEAVTLRAKTAETLRAAVAEEQLFIAQQGRVSATGGEEIINRAIQGAQARISALNTLLADNQKAVDQAQRALAQSQVPNALRRAEAATDPVARATYEYEEALAKLQNRWTSGIMGTGPKARAEFDKQAASLMRVKNAALEAARATGRGGAQREVGGDFTLEDAVAAVRSVGGNPTSTTRSAARNAKVGGVANSFHLSGQAVDVAKGAGVTLNKLVQAIRNKGGRILEALDEGDHFHIAFKTGSAAMEQLARATQRAEDKTTRQNNAFNSEMSELQASILAANRPIAKSYEDELAAFEETLNVERQRQNAAYEAAAAEERVTEAQAQLLIAKNNELASAKLMARYQAEGIRKRQVTGAMEVARQELALDELRFEEDGARSSSERRDIQLRILDAETELERLKLQQIVENTKIGSIEHERATLALQSLDAQRQRRAEGIRRDPGNMSPGARYRDEFIQTAGEMNDALEEVAVDGLQTLQDGLTDAIMGAKSLGDVFDDVADQIIAALVRIAIQQLIIKPMADLLFGPGSGGGGGLFGGGGGVGGLLQSFGSIFGMGGGGGGFNTNGVIDGLLMGRAKGGRVRAGQGYMVGERGAEGFVPDQNGTIIPSNTLANFIRGGDGGGAVRVEVVSGEMFDVRVTRISGNVAAQTVRAAAPSIIETATANTASKLGRRRM